MPAELGPILTEITALGKTVGILDDQEKIRQFLNNEINGDTLVDQLVISAVLSKDRYGLLVYLLTSAKFVKIEIDKEKVQSYSCYLKEVTGVSRSLLTSSAGNNAQVSVEFPQGNFGLQYPANTGNIDSFFQKVDENVRKIKISLNDPKTGSA